MSRFKIKWVAIAFRCSSREPDFDGLVSSFKHVIDGLVEAGILENDKQANIGQPRYLWERTAPKGGKIRVRVEEIKTERIERE